MRSPPHGFMVITPEVRKKYLFCCKNVEDLTPKEEKLILGVSDFWEKNEGRGNISVRAYLGINAIYKRLKNETKKRISDPV